MGVLGRGAVALSFLGMAGLLSGDEVRVYGKVTRGEKGGVSGGPYPLNDLLPHSTFEKNPL